jgi:Cft2 family RNA processing exonuclease
MSQVIIGFSCENAAALRNDQRINATENTTRFMNAVYRRASKLQVGENPVAAADIASVLDHASQ